MGQNQHLPAPRGGRDLVEACCCQQRLGLVDVEWSTAKHVSRVREDSHLEGIRRGAGCQGNNDPPVGPQGAVDMGDAGLERGARDEGLRQSGQVEDRFVGHFADRLQP